MSLQKLTDLGCGTLPDPLHFLDLSPSDNHFSSIWTLFNRPRIFLFKAKISMPFIRCKKKPSCSRRRKIWKIIAQKCKNQGTKIDTPLNKETNPLVCLFGIYIELQLRIKLFNDGLLAWLIVIYEALCFDVAQGRLNGAPNETRTHSCRLACQACKPLHYPRCPLAWLIKHYIRRGSLLKT